MSFLPDLAVISFLPGGTPSPCAYAMRGDEVVFVEMEPDLQEVDLADLPWSSVGVVPPGPRADALRALLQAERDEMGLDDDIDF
jgi:hypothetical protein